MTDWNVPDWRDKRAYGDTGKWPWLRWRWEFVRRCEDYRELFENVRESRAQIDLEAAEGIYGFRFLLDPRRDDYPEHMLVGPYVPDFVFPWAEEEIRFAWDWQESDCLFRFDIYEPIDEQIEQAKAKLRSLQKEVTGSIQTKKVHPEKWLGYLRTLDARADGASWADIAAIHPNTAQTPQTARDIWNAAMRLRFKEFD